MLVTVLRHGSWPRASRQVATSKNTSVQSLACSSLRRVQTGRERRGRPQGLCEGWKTSQGYIVTLRPVLRPGCSQLRLQLAAGWGGEAARGEDGSRTPHRPSALGSSLLSPAQAAWRPGKPHSTGARKVPWRRVGAS